MKMYEGVTRNVMGENVRYDRLSTGLWDTSDRAFKAGKMKAKDGDNVVVLEVEVKVFEAQTSTNFVEITK